MTSPQTLKRLHKWIWILIYGGLLTLVLGLATQRVDHALGITIAVAGGVVAAVGFALIFVRARMKAEP
ncbi:hypothetical protein [Pseudorhodoferax sp. Leaf267]|uniref:hypothetical protein n=1 Tax=Pseudorhodoferax sp. Leaf267 TaxID=1736316 RepID=UPI0006F2C124|nr:hypothetical protein [Pseudorhodoferax sp. Leaf267]KQP14899.1 hypothetical protein ASF43_12635 [Pseudorhodoferax sp. Leaf267]